mmetsp:Transcript_22787/g.52225  ORF Transcript_22787/g.52225 Transcript_22787/m.52225 type:complete len:149 (+) Transcript_22787:163-609(+)
MSYEILSSLPEGYCYTLAVFAASFFMNFFQTVQVILARKKYDVGYPHLYAPETNKFKKEFDSVQRGHQNTLESYAVVMLQMFVCGLFHPYTAAGCGGLWVAGRVVYAMGYARSGPGGRKIGGLVSHLGDLPLLIMLCKIAYVACTGGY